MNRKDLFCRFAGNSVGPCSHERYTAIDHMEVLMKMLEYGFDPAGEIQISLDMEMMILKVPEYSRTFRLSEHDEIVPGISIANSEVGVLALVHRSLLLPAGMHQRHDRQNRRKFAIQAHQQKGDGRISHGFGGRDKPVQAESRPIHDFHPNAGGKIRKVQSKPSPASSRLPNQKRISSKGPFHMEQGATMFHIIQAFTRAAQDISLSASDAYRLEKAGGTILGMVKS